MLRFILILLIILWFLGYRPLNIIPSSDIILFSLNNQPISLWNVAFLLIVIWLINILPTPFRQVGSIIILLWVLSLLGFIMIPGLSGILAIVIIIGALFYLVGGS